MATIHDAVNQIGQRAGVEVAVVLGRDGLPIDSYSQNGLDPDGVSAMVPAVVEACGHLGQVSTRGEFTSGVMEFGDGFVIVSVIAADALFAVFVRPETDLGQLLYELQTYRNAIVGLL